MKLHIPVLIIGFLLAVLLVGFALTPPTVAAQDSGTPAATEAATEAATQGAANSCSDYIKQALAATDKACADTGRNQACYGSTSVKADPQPGVTNFQFDQPGQIVNVADIKNLEMSALNTDENTWGVTLLRLQANLPGTTAGQFVTMLVFGDVKIQNAVTPPTATLPLTISSSTSVLNRPLNGGAVGRLLVNATTTATGRLKDNTWIRVQLPGKDPNSPITGWIIAKAVPAGTNLDTLDVIDPTAPVYAPMQAFYFQTGVGQQSCQAAPPNGVLIQTPHGSPRVTMMINDAKLTIGSSAFINSDSDMTISTFDGSVTVESKGVTQVVPAGLQVTLPVDSTGKVSGPPEKPVTFKPTDFSNLTTPLQTLPIPISPVRTSQTSVSGAICPAGTAYRTVIPTISLNGQTFPGRTVVAPCTCANGTHTISSSGAGYTASVEICN